MPVLQAGRQAHPNNRLLPPEQGYGVEVSLAVKAVLESQRPCRPALLDNLPWALLGLRAAPKEDSAVSSAEKVFGSPLTIPRQAQKMVVGQNDPPADPPLIDLRQQSYAIAEVAGGRNLLLDGATHICIRQGAMAARFPARTAAHTEF